MRIGEVAERVGVTHRDEPFGLLCLAARTSYELSASNSRTFPANRFALNWGHGLSNSLAWASSR